jgi:hypothetical protein
MIGSDEKSTVTIKGIGYYDLDAYQPYATPKDALGDTSYASGGAFTFYNPLALEQTTNWKNQVKDYFTLQVNELVADTGGTTSRHTKYFPMNKGFEGTAGPIAGIEYPMTYAKNAVVWNTNVASGQPMGWVCSKSGSVVRASSITGTGDVTGTTLTVTAGTSTKYLFAGAFLLIDGVQHQIKKVVSYDAATSLGVYELYANNLGGNVTGKAIANDPPTWVAMAGFDTAAAGGAWGSITGTLTDQTDLIALLGGANIPSPTEFGYVKGLTSSAQTQLSGMLPKSLAYAALADGGYVGNTVVGIAGETLAVGDACYVGASGRYWKSIAATGTTSMPAVQICVAGGLAGTSCTFLKSGYLRHDAWGFAAATTPVSVYVDRTTPGLITTAAPSTVGDQVQILGHVTEVANIVEFNINEALFEVGTGLVDLTSEVSGILPTANGGTGIAYFTAAGPTQARIYTFPDAATTIVGTATTQTLTNKRITKRVGTQTDSSATPTINTDNIDYFEITGQTADITSFTTNLTGTPTTGQTLWISITGTAARAITWGASFEASTVSLPTTTVGTARLDVGFIWNAATSKWRCIASG